MAGWTSLAGLYARAEVGAHLTPSSSAFAYGQADSGGLGAGVGWRWEFGLP